jgi:hypothetical protein
MLHRKQLTGYCFRFKNYVIFSILKFYTPCIVLSYITYWKPIIAHWLIYKHCILVITLTHFGNMLLSSSSSSSSSSVIYHMTGPQPLPKRFLHIMRSRASSFKWEYPLLSPRSSSNFLRLLPRLLVTSIRPFIFPSIICFRRQFLRKIWPIQLASQNVM